MDSKLRSLVITCALLMMFTIISTVILINVRQMNKRSSAEPREEESLETKSEFPQGPFDESYYSYQNDETFFDRDLSEYEKLVRDNEKNLSMYATSVERDLRIQILDDAGRLAAGQELYVLLDGVEYKDLDKDGVVYVGDLSPGNYDVSLRASAGFKVPSAPMAVRVKENVEFLPIEDISLLMKTEDDIDVELEDSEEAVTGDEDIDDSEDRDIRATEGKSVFGIDVSKWNGDIDWVRVRSAGAEFVIIRCGYRGSSTGALVEDPYFRRNIAGAKAAGLQVGLYFFTQAINEVEAVEEASAVLALNGGMDLEYPIFIDIESAGGGRADRLDASQRTAIANAFCKTIESAGYMAGVYSSRSWLYNNLDMAVLDRFITWLAEYRSTPLYSGKYNMWQYTDSGTIDGIDTNVDFNLSYGIKRD